MPLPETISLHRTALARIVAGLFGLLGLTSGMAPARIAKDLHRAIAGALRPAESAVRRLIVFLAADAKAGSLKAQPPARAMPAEIVRNGGANRAPSFRLFDPRPRLILAQRARRARLRISFFGDGEVRTLCLGSTPRPADDGLDTSGSLVRRLQALKSALDDLPRQARRLQRALARRAQLPGLKLMGPLRPGRPPGFRKRAVSEIDVLLHRCDFLAREALPDTS